MSNNSSNNSSVAKNTLFLYFRMLLTIVVGLYTSRVVLNVLGVSDYGIYNVVGGMVNMLSFLNIGISGAVQRFLSFEIGRDNPQRVQLVFSTSVTTLWILAIVIGLFAEIVGVWFLNTHMNIPSERMDVANWVLQFSILTLIVSLISVPYNSCIIAHEHMHVYAYISILEVVLKLCVAISIQWIESIDHLILYALLILCIQVVVRIIYSVYCQHHFPECHFKFILDKRLFKEMFSYAGWSMVGNLGFTFKDQGANIILNLFFGTTVNAARGIAHQINGIISGFAANFSMAINPQIIKRYAANNIDGCLQLVYKGSRISFFLLSLVAIPFLINSNYILHLWLGNVPAHTNIFVHIVLLGSLLYSLSHSTTTAILATGKIMIFQSLLALILLSELPISYIVLWLGGEPYQALLPSLFTISLSLFFRISVLKHYVPQCRVFYYIFNCIGRCIAIFIFCYCISIYIRSFFEEDSIITVILSSIEALVISSITICLGGISSNERKWLFSKIKQGVLKKQTKLSQNHSK